MMHQIDIKYKAQASVVCFLDKESQVLSSKHQICYLQPRITICRELNFKIARILATQILQIQDASSLNISYVNKINFVKHKEILRCFKGLATAELQYKLFSIILESRECNNLKYAPRNAITILNYSKYEFSNKDLSGINIKGADLSEALIWNSNFQGSNLKKVNFSFANIYNTNFCYCDFTDAFFGQLPPIISKNDKPFTSVSWNGDYIAYSNNSRSVFLYSIKYGFTIKEFKHTKVINVVALSKDGHFLATAKKKVLHLWDINIETKIRDFKGHTDLITSISISPKSEFIVTGSYDQSLILWNITKRRIEKKVIINKFISSVAFDTCGRFITFASCNYHLPNLYKRAIFRKRISIFATDAPISLCDKYFVDASNCCTVFAWDLEINKWIKLQFEGTVFNEYNYSLYSKGKHIAVINDKKSIEIWDAKTLENHSSLKEIISISFSYDGKYVASTYGSKSIKIQKFEPKKIEFKLKAHTFNVIFVKFCRFGNFLVSLCLGGCIILWDIIYQCPLKNFEMGKGNISAIDLSFNDEFICAGLKSNEIRVWNIINPSDYYTIKQWNIITCLKFSPCGNYIVSASSHIKRMRLWQNNKFHYNFNGDYWQVSGLSFIQPENYLVSSHDDGVIIIWNISKLKKIRKFRADTCKISAIAVSSCGTYLVTGSIKGSIKIWNARQGIMIKEFLFDFMAINSIQFLNNKTLMFASASADGSIKYFLI